MTFLARLLNYYQLDGSAYAHLTRSLTMDDLPAPGDYPDMDKIVARIRHALAHDEKIIVYGDYDADGVLATAILVDAFKRMGKEVGYYVPNRYQDGYGIHADKVGEIAAKGYKLIITVDNGVNAHEAIRAAYAAGIDVIISDHHEILSDVPPCVGIIHPFLKKEPYPLCGAAMALVLSRALLNRVEPYHIALAALATIADMMPLRQGNRDLVRLGLVAMNENKFPALTLLSESYPLDETAIAMKVTPSINAIGRLIENAQINRLVRFFTTDKEDERAQLAAWIKQTNDSRKKLMNLAVEQLPDLASADKAIVHLSTEKEGLIGLLANRLMTKYDVPTVVFTSDSEDPSHLIGSARTPSGFDLIAAFDKLQPYIIKGGGHANAGGLTVEVGKFEAFKAAFIKYFASIETIVSHHEAIELALTELNWDSWDVLTTLAPFGHDFKAPKFRMRGLQAEAMTFIKDGRYLSTKLGIDTKLLSFDISKEVLAGHQRLDFIGRLQVQTFRNTRELVFMAREFADTDEKNSQV